MLHPLKEAEVRQTVLSWAVSMGREGEGAAVTLARAKEFLEFILWPTRPEVIAATLEAASAAEALLKAPSPSAASN